MAEEEKSQSVYAERLEREEKDHQNIMSEKGIKEDLEKEVDSLKRKLHHREEEDKEKDKVITTLNERLRQNSEVGPSS